MQGTGLDSALSLLPYMSPYNVTEGFSDLSEPPSRDSAGKRGGLWATAAPRRHRILPACCDGFSNTSPRPLAAIRRLWLWAAAKPAGMLEAAASEQAQSIRGPEVGCREVVLK